MRWAKRALWGALALAAFAGIGFLVRPVSLLRCMRCTLNEDFSGVESRTVQVDGLSRALSRRGAGERAGRRAGARAGRKRRRLAQSGAVSGQAGFRVYIPDLLGYGRSEQPADFSYSVRDEAAVVVGFMDALGLKQVDLGGWSMGGWIVELDRREHPERVSRLMLFDAAGLDVKPTWDTGLFTPVSRRSSTELDALLMPHPPMFPGFVARDILRLSRKNGWVVKRAPATMLTAQDVTDKLLPQLENACAHRVGFS